MESPILLTALALVTWTMVVWLWMYATRIPAMSQAGIEPDDAKHPGSLNSLPSGVRGIADNYNHLHEQPTVFYALVFYSALAGTGAGMMFNLAWAYVILRVIHSLVQNTTNKVMLRFPIFALSSLCLIAMVVMNLLQMP